ncbi:MAG TPA: hypothetical protein VIJ47_13525, partial [Acidimicrobiales bacterium]
MDETTPDTGQPDNQPRPALADLTDGGAEGAGGGRHGVRRWQIIVAVVVLVALVAGIAVAVSRRTGTNDQVSTATTVATAGSASTEPSGGASTTTTVAADVGTWSLIPAGPNPPGQPVAWTGTELLVTRAGCCGDLGSDDFSAYDPATKTWRQLPPTPLTGRSSSAGAWTGTQMIVAGGLTSPDGYDMNMAPAADGAVWTAAANTWRPIAAMPTPLVVDASVWTGQEMLVWSADPDTVLAYKPATDTWRSLPPSGLSPRHAPVAVWTGTDFVVWGGVDTGSNTASSDGARLDPATGTWRPLPTAPVPARARAAAVWSGHEVLVWGGDTGGANPAGTPVGQGVAYDPVTDTWRALPLSPLRAKVSPAGVWTGRFFLVIGGRAGGGFPVPGPGSAAYDPATNTWTTLPTAVAYPPLEDGATGPTGPADQRSGGLAVWTGTSALVVGGQ